MSRFCTLFFLFTNHLLATIIAIEGMPGAGKTSLLFRLASRLEGRCVVLSEMNPEPCAAWQHMSCEEQNAQFHALWVERMQVLKQFPKETLFLLDRSYISNLAFAFALAPISHTISSEGAQDGASDLFSPGRKHCPNDKESPGEGEDDATDCQIRLRLCEKWGLDQHLYEKRKEQTSKEIENREDLVIVLDASPKCSLQRRLASEEIIQWPWTELPFLEKFQEFYSTELHDYSIVYVQTDHLSQEEVYQTVYSILEPYIYRSELENPEMSSTFPGSPIHFGIETLLDFAHENGLGSRHSAPVSVFGFPTLYFPKHSVQLDIHGMPHFFNNERLKILCEKLQS